METAMFAVTVYCNYIEYIVIFGTVQYTHIV